MATAAFYILTAAIHAIYLLALTMLAMAWGWPLWGIVAAHGLWFMAWGLLWLICRPQGPRIEVRRPLVRSRHMA